ncbi:MAG: hypothetical protein LC104_17520 [Bacteroidales bacterium]|nr:hypothetical protein [Bacteroidales bacterium]
MARKRRGPETAPARNDVYVGMLALTFLAMTVGTALLAMECNEYGWESEPTAGSPVSIPDVSAIGSRPVAPAVPADGAGVRVPPQVPQVPRTEPADLTGPAPIQPPLLAPLIPTVPVSAQPDHPAIR